ncbi:MAG: Coenzyme F420 hydrogenase/dehydrogenase, beta subunit C-terminal domain [Clostridia bacterium]|nr:Coenzyme F420 hydrogenase/dehydrogenase, beta subunit C-terminal domain [Clostridia bacterium]
MLTIHNKSDCTGCAACVNTCPENCITLKFDEEGFAYPLIDKKQCINCSACDRVCPVNKKVLLTTDPVCFAGYIKDDSIRQQSSSGGIFSALALEILSRGGVVFGAAFDGVSKVKHFYIDNINDLGKLRTSKYIQSEIDSSYKDTKKFLQNNRLVLFTGTPCQIAGLKSFLGKEYENLYTQDIICHGAPSQLVWSKYVNNKQQQYKDKIGNINFRNKEFGWKDFSVKYESNNRCENTVHRDDLFFKAFLKNIILRPSCYYCKFKGENFFSDITLGDFWGIEYVSPEMNDNQGVSLIICRNNKGKKLLTDISDSIIIKDVEYENSVRCNTAATKSVPKPGSRDLFFKYIKHHKINSSLKLFCSENEKEIAKVQLMEDYKAVKSEKGVLFALIWRIKTILCSFLIRSK